MLRKPPPTIRSRSKVLNPETRYNILQSQSDNYYSEILQYENTLVSEKAMLTLKDFETVTTSKRNFYLVVNEIPDDKTGHVSKASTSDRTVTSILTAQNSDSIEILDSVRSGESLIKHFNFDTSKYNGDTNKCIAFWRTLMKTGIQPVKCTLIKACMNWNKVEKQERKAKGKEKRKERIEEEEEKEVSSEIDNYMWYKALVELQRRKMDEVAFAATSQKCKLCQREEPYVEFKKRHSQRFSKDELKDAEDIKCLNNWNPIKIKKKYIDASMDSKPGENTEVLHSTSSQEKDNFKQQPEIIYTLQPPSDLDSSLPEESMESDFHTASSTEETNEQNATESYTRPEECECRREICRCNKIWTRNPSTVDGMVYISTPMDSERINVTPNTLEEATELPAVTVRGNEYKKDISQQFTKTCTCGELDCECDKTDQDEPSEKELLPECNFCKDHCNCWEHKINMSKKFIDDLRYEMNYKETRQDKSCEQSIEEEEVKKSNRFCVICGHNYCHCNGPEQHARHKYFQYIQFDDDVITLLLEQKEKLSKRAGSHSLLEKDTQKQLSEHQLEDVKVTHEPSMPHKINATKKKLLITPEQRAKQMVNKKTHILEIDKYGIPQVIRYADGKIGPKRVTSEDILSSSTEDIAAAK